MATLNITEKQPDDAPQSAPAPPIGGRVLDEARMQLARFWAPPDVFALDVMTLWAAHTHCTDKDGVLATYSTPRLALVSDEHGSGKTMALDLLNLLCPRGEQITDPTAPALLDLIATKRATLLIDEVDLLFGAGQAAKAVRAVINSGYRRGARVARVKGPQDTFSPVALAGLASSFMGNATLAPTRSRSIIIHCRKPAPGTRVARYREQLHAGVLSLAGSSLAGWAASHLLDITTAWPDMPPGLDGRQEDIWMPLFAVASVAGGDWPMRARWACLAYTTGTLEIAASEQLPPRLRLIRDIRAVWTEGDIIGLADLAERLSRLGGAPWPDMWSPVAMAREIPAMLGVAPVRVTVSGRDSQGYFRTQFGRLWAEIPKEAS